MKYYNLESIPKVRLEQIHEVLLSADWHLVKVPDLFSPERLLATWEGVKSEYTLRNKDNWYGYKGICLQHSPHDTDPVFDQLDTTYFVDYSGQTKRPKASTGFADAINTVGHQFDFVFQALEPYFSLIRGRIFCAEPGFQLNRHKDAPQSATLHIPITTNPLSHFIIGEKEFHLPADGSLYMINTGLPHFVYNVGKTERAHMAFPAPPISFRKLMPLDRNRFSEYVQFAGLA